jgi:hypothetical protein
MYGVGARLDDQPDLLFVLRKVEQAELIAGSSDFKATRGESKRKTIADDEIGDVFGIEIADLPADSVTTVKQSGRRKPRAEMTGRVEGGTARRKGGRKRVR